MRFNREAMEHFLRFAASGEAVWKANFRDLNAAVTRMATLAPGVLGRGTKTFSAPKKAGTYAVTVSATDLAGNFTRVLQTVRVS